MFDKYKKEFSEEKFLDKYKKEFSEEKFWDKLKKKISLIGYEGVYQALVLLFAFKDPFVPMKAKATIVGALGYLIAPFELLPDIAPMGFTDDFAVIAAAVVAIEVYVTPETKKLAKDKVDELFKIEKEAKD